MKLSERQKEIVYIVKENEPISGDSIAKKLGLSKATLRSDLAILNMTGILDARPKVGYFYSGQSVEPLLFEKLYNNTVSSIMTPPLIVKQNISIYDAITTLFMYDVGSLYVINEDEKLAGVISRKDLLRATINNTQLNNTPVAVVMTRMPNIITTTKDARIIDAGYLIMNHKIDSLPIVDSSDGMKVIGKVTKTKIMEYFIKSGIEIENEKI